MQQIRQSWWLLLIVCLLACGARTGLLLLRSDQLSDDRDAYLEIAFNLVRHGSFAKDFPPHPTAYRPPLMPLLMALVLWLKQSMFALGLIHVVLGTLTTALTFRVGQLLGLGRTSAIAAALVAIDPLLLQSTVSVMTEALCATLVILWCWVWLEFPAQHTQTGRPRVSPSLLHGACFGLLCLCRPGFLATAGLGGIWLLFELARRFRNPSLQASVRNLVLPAVWSTVGLAVLLAPWTIRNAIVMGKVTPATTHGGYTLLLANNPVFYHEVVLKPCGTAWSGESLTTWQRELETGMAHDNIAPADEVARDRWMYRHAYLNIQAEPWLFLRSCVWRAIRFWDLAPWRPDGYPKVLIIGTAIFYGIISCLIIIGLCRLHRVEWEAWAPLLFIPLTLWMTHWFYWTDMRMRAPVFPILALVAARAVMSRTKIDAANESPTTSSSAD